MRARVWGNSMQDKERKQARVRLRSCWNTSLENWIYTVCSSKAVTFLREEIADQGLERQETPGVNESLV